MTATPVRRRRRSKAQMAAARAAEVVTNFNAASENKTTAATPTKRRMQRRTRTARTENTIDSWELVNQIRKSNLPKAAKEQLARPLITF